MTEAYSITLIWFSLGVDTLSPGNNRNRNKPNARSQHAISKCKQCISVFCFPSYVFYAYALSHTHFNIKYVYTPGFGVPGVGLWGISSHCYLTVCWSPTCSVAIVWIRVGQILSESSGCSVETQQVWQLTLSHCCR